jgi:putative oxidoreductase
MTTNVALPGTQTRPQDAHRHASESLRFLAPVGRALFALIFIVAAFGHFSSGEVAYAEHAGVPLARIAVPGSGVLSLIGGLSVLLGYRTRIGAWIIVVFLIPVTVMMHNFWAMSDPMMVQMQLAMFLKNVSMLGGALLLAYFGAGPFSLDARHGR